MGTLPCLPSAAEQEDAEEEEEEREEYFTPLEVLPMEPSASQVLPATLGSNGPVNNKAQPFSDCKRVLSQLHHIKPLIIPLVLMLIMPWLVTKYLILPWFIVKALQEFERQVPLILDMIPDVVRRAARTAEALTKSLREPLAPLIEVFIWGLLLPWMMWLGFCMLWAVVRVVKSTWNGERNVSLASHLTILCIFPAVVGSGIVPWFARKMAGLSIVLISSLLTHPLELFMAYLVMAAAHERMVH